MKQLNILQFIRDHEDWEKLLSEKPYAITVTRKQKFGRNLMMLKYSQIDSDFSNPVVRECRGLILDEDSLEVISFPFMKFCNFGEPYADSIDWASAKILEKVDGSLIKIVRLEGEDNLLISTNGTIDADDAPIPEQIGCPFKSFGDAVRQVLQNYDWDYLFPDENVTYMFELVSPWTKVVIPYPETDLYFLGCRDNLTFEETLPQDHRLAGFFKTPKVYEFNSFEDCIKAAEELPWDEEGYVVVDKYFHRVKVKSPAWISVHHLKDNGGFSYSRAVELIRANELDEVLGYFPELKGPLYAVKEKYMNLIAEEEAVWNAFDNEFAGKVATRKEQALWITSHSKNPGIHFSMLDRKVSSVREWVDNYPADKLVKILGFKE